MSTDLSSAALDYCRRGWRVFPVAGKVPRLTAWPAQATTNEATARRWWQTWPTADIGIATGGGLLVLDVDPRHGGDNSIAELERHHGPLPDTPRSLTGGGGVHLYCAVDQPIGNRTGLAPGIDLRGDGGFVVAPPSRHANGRRYEWDLGSSPDDVPLAQTPTWLVALIHRRSQAQARRPGTPLMICAGERNVELFRLACRWRRDGIGEAALFEMLRTVNEHHVQPPLGPLELRRIATSAGRYAPARRAEAAA
jgi:putative DNA primase/helicase